MLSGTAPCRSSRARAGLLLAVTVLPACGGDDSVLGPASPSASRVAQLSWLLFLAATAVTVFVFAYLAFGLFRRRRDPDEGDDADGDDPRRGERWLLGGGVLLPIVVITPLIGYSVVILADEPDPGAVEVEVIAHQYWWEYRYPSEGITTANELHIPAGEPVDLRLRSDDVLHSLWVPSLGGKTDLVPGQVNTMTIEADEPGTHQGRCAEYCGLQHAKMLFLVVAQPRDEFEDWVDEQRDEARPPEGATAARGRELFASQGCASCHTVRGTDADGRLGPDLTHVASRRTLAAGVLENTPDDLRRWIGDTWDVKNRAKMPPIPLSDEEVDAIATYLETLE